MFKMTTEDSQRLLVITGLVCGLQSLSSLCHVNITWRQWPHLNFPRHTLFFCNQRDQIHLMKWYYLWWLYKASIAQYVPQYIPCIMGDFAANQLF